MSAWGAGISSNDTYTDVYGEFFELYNKGHEPDKITSMLLKKYHEDANSLEEKNNFWFAIAKAQWECKALDDDLLNTVEHIITSGADIKLWKDLGATKATITQRRKYLDKFLSRISIPKKHPKKRRKMPNAIFNKGDCLVFKLPDGHYSGAFVLEAEKSSRESLNLIVITTIYQLKKPTLEDFKNANVSLNSTNIEAPYWTEWDNVDPMFEGSREQFKAKYPELFTNKANLIWFYSKDFKKANIEFEVIGQLNVKKIYTFGGDWHIALYYKKIQAFDWNLIPSVAIETQSQPENNIKLKKLRARNKVLDFWLCFKYHCNHKTTL